jgi:hypothetical protein
MKVDRGEVGEAVGVGDRNQVGAPAVAASSSERPLGAEQTTLRRKDSELTVIEDITRVNRFPVPIPDHHHMT